MASTKEYVDFVLEQINYYRTKDREGIRKVKEKQSTEILCFSGAADRT